MMQKYFEKLKAMGADEAVEIQAGSIVTAAWTIYKCQFGCKRYGTSPCCPPKVPGYKQTQEIIDCYDKAILFRCHDMGSVAKLAGEMARELFIDGYYKTIAFSGAVCTICKECNPDVCNFPQKAVPSMEGCGVDVFATVRANGFEINTLKSKDEIPNYFGLILVE